MLINQARNLASLPYRRSSSFSRTSSARSSFSARRRTSPSTSSRSTRCSSSNTATSRCRRPTAARRRRALALAEHRRRLAGRHARAGRRRRQYRHQPHADVGAGRPEPGRDRRAAGDAGRQPASRPPVAAAFRPVALLAANGRASALTEAERAAAAEQGREQRRRFLTPGTATSPATRRCSTTATEGAAMDGKMLARLGASYSSPSPSRRPRSR
jgi:hypothetical protein